MPLRSPRRFRLPTALLCGLALCLSACAPGDEPFARLSGLVFDARLKEISGLAASHVHDDVFWAINDGGNDAALYAIGRSGRMLARHAVKGVQNTDWEDLASFELEGRHYLLVADTGDNGGLRKTLQLHAIPEPQALDGGDLTPAWSIAFRWPDGAMDCEAVAVDAAGGRILLVSKNRVPAELFSVPLRPGNDDLQVARKLGPVAGIPQPTAQDKRQKHSRAGRRGLVTAADVSPDGRTLALVTYAHLLLYDRADAATGWADTVAAAPRRFDLPLIPQAEAAAWTPGGRGLVATGEFSPAPLFFLVPPPATGPVAAD